MKKAGLTATALGASLAGPKAFAAPPFFKLYLMIPNNQPARMVWGTLAAQQMAKLGIDVVSSFNPFTVIGPRRANADGATHVDGGWDAYLERYYYNSILPVPNTLFHSDLFPPAGQNFYRVNDPEIDKALEQYGSSSDPQMRAEAIRAFEKRWYDTEPMTILFYPEDVIAVNPRLSGFNGTTFNPVFFPDPENWTIEDQDTAAFASWAPPSSLVPMYTSGYNEANIFGPVYNRLFEYDSWQNKELVPALATSAEPSADGKAWTVRIREGVLWHSGEELTANDVKFTWDVIMNPAYGCQYKAAFDQIFGSPNAYKVTGRYEIQVELPAYSILFKDWVLGAMAIMPEHAYKDIPPESFRSHAISTWLGSYEVTKSDGSTYTAYGAIGTGPWMVDGHDPARRSYKYTKNPDYWKETPGNIETFYIVNIQGADSVLSALKAGEIDAHDPMYDIASLADTIDESWGKVQAFDSFKWQHVCYNLSHPVFGTGVDTPLGKQDPSRAAEAAAYIRKAISYAMPRDQIVNEIASGYGHPGTVPIPWSAPEYDHEMLKPIAFDMDLAREFMTKAGYTY
ncbi:ABC transporter substrate-binding protein [Marinivivus vitaminiproducens]|uniref:ABC transporter substrate-binding protein n=1 Tax=Marinivivus vitaminiproducens TaxID=3035935 RepID=UPI0027A4BD43|nr:ABC transporter substrate-binding protein [Geminicoccaceae bacterium SCSIO 64248]